MEDLILVTGASGFLATHVVQQLLKSGFRVRGTVRSLKNQEKVAPLYKLCPEANHNLELVECDLMNKKCWSVAVKDCTFVLHTASPITTENPKDEDELVKPAVEGTLTVLRASKETGTVKRFVYTSSTVTIAHFHNPDQRPMNEDDWSDISDRSWPYYPYVKSKTLAEKAAWDFINNIKGGNKMELTVVNPSLILGPILCGSVFASMDMIKRLLDRSVPLLPRIGISICDVRDVAAAHIKAMLVPEAAGRRHIVDSGSLWFHDIANILDKEFRPLGYKIPTTNAPKCVMWLAGHFDGTVKMIYPSIGQKPEFDNYRLRNILDISPYPVNTSIIDMGYSLIDNGRVKKTKEYCHRNGP